jgi:tetratricopeptide (TPR) repeat protein
VEVYDGYVGDGMGELLICHESIASLPYYVEGIGLNIYSMEELCYYISVNTYLLDRSFMNEELCTWVEKQMGIYKLAERLRDILRQQGLLSEFVLAILEYTGYSSMKERQDIAFIVRQMEEKSDFECNKIRADQLMEKEKYLSAIYEYKRLLDTERETKTEPALIGNIWHNLGTAYTRLFLFQEAARCYEQAYTLNQTGESLRECLMCYQCMHDEEGFRQKASEHHLDDMGMQEILNELEIAGRSEKTEELEQRLEEIDRMNENQNKPEAKAAVSDIIFAWKEEYRRSCKV